MREEERKSKKSALLPLEGCFLSLFRGLLSGKKKEKKRSEMMRCDEM